MRLLIVYRALLALVAASSAIVRAGTIPDPNSATVARASASVAIIASEGPTEVRSPILSASPPAAVDGEGRQLSLSYPNQVTLYGRARGDRISARTVLEPIGSGAARIAIALDRPLTDGVGTYAAVLTVSLAYN